MPSYSRRQALKTLPALAVGLSGCSMLSQDDEGKLPMQTAWHYRIDEPTHGLRPADGPLLVGSRSPFRDGTVLTAIDAETGDERWTVSGAKGRGSPVGADDEYAYVFSKAEEMFAVDYATGETVWEKPIDHVDYADPGVVEYAPIPLDDSVVVPVSGTENDAPDRLVGFDRESGAHRFTYDLPASLAGAPARDGRGVIVPLLDGTLRRMNSEGTEQWRLDVGATLSAVAVNDGTAYVGSATEQLLAFDAESGERRWSGSLENTVFTRPLVTDDTVYVGAADYYLYAFDRVTGRRRWRTETANAITSGPTMAGGKLVTLVGGNPRQRGDSGTVPFSPTALYVHDMKGALVNEYRFDGYLEGGQVRWGAVIGDGVYLGQGWQLARLDEEVLSNE
ncbi:outer membrane protein assembly factor BamB family protein [Halorussus halophilus]|uniref:outer membrane protein assembly factor BamB family protein n=1 Tax=Halorussus halophilus TaxID=2650975 RepID=UPI001300CFF4|nr:PQQ-binding-like beta-propeller repeat protein [Halorussus halophilus]